MKIFRLHLKEVNSLNELIRKINQVISEEETVNVIRTLVSIPSYAGVENQESGVAKYIYDFFITEGIKAEIVPVVDGRNNVIARIKGKGKGKTLLLTGHTDTVPPYDMPGNPFEVKLIMGGCTAVE